MFDVLMQGRVGEANKLVTFFERKPKSNDPISGRPVRKPNKRSNGYTTRQKDNNDFLSNEPIERVL